jgi:putative chitinase
MVLTSDILKKIYIEAPLKIIEKFIEPLNSTINKYEISTPQRLNMFLAQIGHESGQLHYVKELASGTAYEGRADLGNTSPGDGVRYKGRGLIQITGKHNYEQLSLDLELPLLEKPEMLEEPHNAALSAGWFWNRRNLNSLADMGMFQEITKRINGGMNGYPNRYRLLQIAMTVIT